LASNGGVGLQNEAGFKKIQMWHDLESNLMLHHCLIKLSN
jgi:hypothetical protein